MLTSEKGKLDIHAATLLPGYPIAYIGFSLIYAHRFLSEAKYPNVNFNLLQQGLVGPAGGQFIKAIRRAERKLYVWTVNEEIWMRWSIKKGVDGVITDDPKKFRELCDRYSQPKGKSGNLVKSDKVGLVKKVKLYTVAFFIQLLSVGFLVLWWRRLNTRGKVKKGKGEDVPTSQVLPITS